MSGIVLALLIFSGFFLAHLAFSHLVAVSRKERALVRFMLAAGVAYVVAYAPAADLASAVVGPPAVRPAVDFVTGLAAMGFLVLGYVEFWSLFERSFSLRILIDTNASSSGLTAAEIAEAYADGRGLGWMMEKRVDDLVGSGMLVKRDESYCLSPRARAIARIFQLLQRALGVVA